MKIPSMLMSVVVAGLTALPLTVSCRAEEAKIPFSKGTKIEVMIGRPTKTKGGDFDDKTQTLNPRVKMTNIDNKQGYLDYKVTFLLLGQSIVDSKVIKVLHREEIPTSILPRQVLDHPMASVTTMYDTDGAKFGFKYDGWIVQVADSKGEIVHTKSSAPSLEKLPKEIQAMQAEQCYNKQLKAVPEPRLRL
jgi:hypothetical protein